VSAGRSERSAKGNKAEVRASVSPTRPKAERRRRNRGSCGASVSPLAVSNESRDSLILRPRFRTSSIRWFSATAPFHCDFPGKCRFLRDTRLCHSRDASDFSARSLDRSHLPALSARSPAICAKAPRDYRRTARTFAVQRHASRAAKRHPKRGTNTKGMNASLLSRSSRPVSRWT